MLPVQAVLDVLAYINLVDYLVSILLQGSREYHYLIVLGHQLNELHASRSYQEEAVLAVLNIVNQGFIQVKHKSVCLLSLFADQLRQERRTHLW